MDEEEYDTRDADGCPSVEPHTTDKYCQLYDGHEGNHQRTEGLYSAGWTDEFYAKPERLKVGDVVDYGEGFFPLRVEYVSDGHGLHYECSWVVAGAPVESRAYYMHEHLRPHKP